MKNLECWLSSLQRDGSPGFSVCRDKLATYFPLLERYESTEQDSQWHAEGNVAIHTDMVLNELYCLLNREANHIQGQDRQALILSALLHDIAKPITTRSKEIAGVERVVASGHEERGLSYLAIRLLALPLEYDVIHKVMALVGYHHMPKLLVVKNQGYGQYLNLALNADIELLYWLEVADMRGRLCSDLDSQLDLLDQFKMFAEEYGVWQDCAPFSTATRSIQVKATVVEQIYLDSYAVRLLIDNDIHMAEEAVSKTYQSSSSYSHLYVMCGVSGSGKSSWIAANLKDFEVISLDEIRRELNGGQESQKNRGRVLQLAKERLKTALAKKRNVVWDATNIRRDFRKVVCDYGRNYGALVTMVVFQLAESILIKRDSERSRSVGRDVISDQIDRLQWPEFSEAHRTMIVGENGKLLSKLGSFDKDVQ
ncbi:AAA family ATPase [Marinobacterium jannaschii]|uniref:AAA family ATPase n=1 Tax=Marinobacterium jannaschii TaxID=64970 RepID=UPI0004862547|nr:AAA family ATPase [Marinobacterium jannaschii]